LPPIPIINPVLFSCTPLGNEPLIVNPGVPVLLEDTTIPLPIVATTLLVAFHPAFTANVLKLPFVVLVEMVKANSLALP
jgi:hypothetical protein